MDVSGESRGPAGNYLQLLPRCPSGPQTLRLPRAVMRGPAFFVESVTCKHGGRKKKDAALCSQLTAQESWRHSCNSRARSGPVPAAPCPSRGGPRVRTRPPLAFLEGSATDGPRTMSVSRTLRSCFLFFVFNRNFTVASVSRQPPGAPPDRCPPHCPSPTQDPPFEPSLS